MGLNINP